MIQPRRGFTLLELLVVIGIISLMASMILFMPKSEQKAAAVASAAEELAATLRQARAMAIERRCVIGVAFNIANGAGTSGVVLNNQDGGHWYRIIGPDPYAMSGLASPPDPSFSYHGSVSAFLRDVDNSWIGDKTVLPPGRVRFLALSDQDDGTKSWIGQGRYPETYPRPWFGWYDPVAGRLHPWGGYDPAIVDANGKSCSAFYYQGGDGPIVGSRNPNDVDTTWNDTSKEPWGTVRLLSAGEVRPVVNAQWLDLVIAFYPDGSARLRKAPMDYRRRSYDRRGGATNHNARGGTGEGDLGIFSQGTGSHDTWKPPMTYYTEHTGRWTITLAPDTVVDSDRFASAEDALASIWPLYRVSVTPLGAVDVDRVTKLVPDGAVLDTTISDWSDSNQIRNRYANGIATSNSQGDLRDEPIRDFLNAEILEARQWWLDVP